MSHAASDGPILMIGDTVSSADIRHILPVKAPDPVICFEHADRYVVYVNSLDAPLFADIPGADVVSFDTLAETVSWDPVDFFAYFSELAVLACRDQHVDSVTVSPQFPFAVAQSLLASGISVNVDARVIMERRRVKTPLELEGARRAVRAVEAAWDGIREVLQSPGPTTSEELHARVVTELAAFDAIPYDIIIVPHGEQTATGHHGGAGVISAGEPIIADLIAKDRETGMYADLTRTFCVGDPPAELSNYFELCSSALSAAIEAIAPGVAARELDDVVSTFFEQAGQPTERATGYGKKMDHGFYGGLGHGVGLEVHEPPLLKHEADLPLLEGEVLCVEPALYRAGFGGCRLEDMILVTSNGAERLSTYEYALAP